VAELPSGDAYEMLVLRDVWGRQQWCLDLSMKPSLALGQIAKFHFANEKRSWEHTPLEKAALYRAMEKKAGNDKPFIGRVKAGFAPTSPKGKGQGSKGKQQERSPNKPKGKDGKSKSKGQSGGKESPKGGRPTPKRLQTAQDMRNGKRLCKDWNNGGCSDQCKKNPQEEHRCNGMLADGSACASTWHRSNKCTKCIWK
jgi:hypothetical protein